MGNYIDEGLDWLLSTLQLDGYAVLMITLPLAVIQAFLGIYPFAALIMLHISALGLGSGLLVSWGVGIISTLIVYLVFERFFSEWFQRKWLNKLKRYSRWQSYMDHYGIWALIVLRTLPIMPNNLVSFMASVSSIRFRGYVWSSVWGMLSHIWLFGILSSTVLAPQVNVAVLIMSYVIFCGLMLAVFAVQQVFFVKQMRKKVDGPSVSEPPQSIAK
ncbi:L-seryl-tRNA selenium transferase [Paenibacillus sp. CAA11]|uniref:TVP38/TMEM64 family protein n=1 Tax=Paenibacillus sp. CAA11 TaxID=1532905 RepID=UPI000D3B98D5|nr:VTT domain-containing protein [Paenibacillus sp. CAA11]AWB44776.1 L-seryl-tRNA selenium transferase [Paenibacillus sp. CAA11]